ncbi:hypothetical protein C2G38_2257165 [Gigaspora rosea]|uniref:RZ-type domain-containing protein n=1 Tax=Gigaspora rosea TaxID=44941 RepID=A0A397W8I3_9GLOM|nr:hypothetical protein C2G38_2257165 [Gigaspora rosea]
MCEIFNKFGGNKFKAIYPEIFKEIIRKEQEDYIKRMTKPPQTAENDALLENVLVMIVCILTRIPVFIIGAPGASKSLAIRLVSQNLRGSDSDDPYFRGLPQVYVIPHQGSSSSTSDGIVKVFDKANNYQKGNSDEFTLITVVLLDEIGLAETSPYNPLKVLYSLLEPSYPAELPNVSVIRISNWRLDNSKSSRASIVQRPKFEQSDLIDTAKWLLEKNKLKTWNSFRSKKLQSLANSYLEYEKNQPIPNFHGLRDYYSFIKSLNNGELKSELTQMLFARNFGGTDQLNMLCQVHFNDKKNPKTDQIHTWDLDPVIIYGSQFPDDFDGDYQYGILNRIMMCIEAGKPLILTDIEVIYGSLYDLWNQNYITVGRKGDQKYYTRIALGAYSNPMNGRGTCKLDKKYINLCEEDMSVLDFNEHDIFVGLDREETLQSLVILNSNNLQLKDENNILDKCKEQLLGIALFHQVTEEKQGFKVIINTFSNINADINSYLKDIITCQIDKISIFKSKAQLQSRIKYFWQESKAELLILQCDLTTINAGCIKLAKFLIEQYSNKSILQEQTKHVCIILHMRRKNDKPTILSFNFMCGWDLVTIENLTKQEYPLSTYLDGNLIEILNITNAFDEIINQDLLWCLLCMKFQSSDESANYIKFLARKIPEHIKFLDCLKIRTFNCNDDISLFEFWKKIFMDTKIVDIKFMAEPKPDVYFVPNKGYNLKFPFLTYFMDQINKFKRLYQQDFEILAEEEENFDEETRELKAIIVNDCIERFFNNIMNVFPLFKMLYFYDAADLYFKDFVSIISPLSNDEENNELLCWIISHHMKQQVPNPIRLHVHWWYNADFILAELQLTLLFPDIKEKVLSTEFDESLELNFEDFLLEQVSEMMMENLCSVNIDDPIDDTNNTQNHLQLWQRNGMNFLLLSNKLSSSFDNSTLLKLRVYNDLSKSLPFMKLLKIRKFESELGNDDMFSEQFIEIVFEKLDELEQTEQNLSTRRSFVYRCLGVLQPDSPVRLHPYMKIFSQDPLPLTFVTIYNIFYIESFEKLAQYYLKATEILITNDVKALQLISAIALLKTFANKLWNSTVKSISLTDPIEFKFEADKFSIDHLNNQLTLDQPLIHSFKVYLLKLLRLKGLSINEVKQFCETQQQQLSWLGILHWDDHDSRLDFNPYWCLDHYKQTELASKKINIGDKSHLNEILYEISDPNVNNVVAKKVSFAGMIITKFYLIQASRELKQSENYLSHQIIECLNSSQLPTIYKNSLLNFLSNKYQFCKITTNNDNTKLFISSVVAHIVALHISIPANASPLAAYMQNLQNYKNTFILACPSNEQSVLLNLLIVETKQDPNYMYKELTRYTCSCGYIYVVADCGNVIEESKCPNCKKIIGAVNGEYGKTAQGAIRLDEEPLTQIVNDQDEQGYIIEMRKTEDYYSVRSMSPAAYRILHLFVHAIIGIQAPSDIVTDFITNNKNANNVGNIINYCRRHINNDWEMLKNNLACGDEHLSSIIHSILSEMSQDPLQKVKKFTTPIQREAWEAQFSQRYVSSKIKNAIGTATDFRMVMAASTLKIENEINEIVMINDKYCKDHLPRLWCLIGETSMNSFKAYYSCNNEYAKSFLFINVFLKHEKYLSLIKHMLPIVKFTQILSSCLSYRIERQVARKLTFQQFIINESERDDTGETMRSLNEAFNSFMELWNTLAPHIK